MADLTPEQIQEQLQVAAEEQANLGRISKNTAVELDNVSKASKKANENINRAFKKLGNSTLDLGRAMLTGQQGASAYNDVLGDAAESLATVAEKWIPYFGKMIGTAIRAGGEYVKEVTKQADALYKSYQDMSKVGATGAQGMKGVFDNMQKFGYGIEELDKMTALIRENSTALASFRGTASSGADAFANVANTIQRSDLGKQFQYMGVTVDDINRGLASYIRLQTTYGQSQRMTQDQVTAGSARYLEQLTLMSKVTGTSADEIAKQQENAMSENAYAAKRYELQQQAAAGDNQARNKLEQMEKMIAGQSNNPGIQRAIIKAYGGFLNDPEVQALQRSAPEAYADIISMNHDASRATQYLGRELEGGMNQFGSSIAAGFNPLLGSAKEMVRVIGDNNKTLDERIAIAKTEAGVTDDSTKSMTDMMISQRNTRDSLQSFVKIGLNVATMSLKKLAEAGDALTATLPGDVAGRPENSLWDRLTNLVTGKPIQPTTTIPGGGNAGGGKSAKDLKDLGLNVKPGDVQKDGAQLSGKLIDLAKAIQGGLPNFGVFTGFNDQFHQERAPNSSHTKGTAVDFTLTQRPTDEQGKQIVSWLKSNGASFVLDEYNHPSAGATAGHIHAEVGGYQFGGVASGPLGGYEATLSGNAGIVPLPDGKNIPVEMPGFTDSLDDQTDILSTQIDKLDDLIRVMNNQVSVSQKILQSQA